MTKIKQTVSIFWFRRDLRFEDNHALFEATKSETQILPLFIFDTDILSQLEDKNDRRVDFVYQALTDLQNKLLPIGRSICIRIGKPLDIFKILLEEYDVKAVYTNSDYERSAIARDRAIEAFLKTNSIRFLSFKNQVIFEWNEVLKTNGEPYSIFTPYSKVWKQKLSENDLLPYPSEDFINKFIPLEHPSFPSLTDIGFNKTDMMFSTPVLDKNIIANYENTRIIPAIEGLSLIHI